MRLFKRFFLAINGSTGDHFCLKEVLRHTGQGADLQALPISR